MIDQADRRVLAGLAVIIVAMAVCILSIAVVAALAVRVFFYISGV